MKKTGIFYGSSTGTCEDLANQIADKMGVPHPMCTARTS
jgi:flavodoxin I